MSVWPCSWCVLLSCWCSWPTCRQRAGRPILGACWSMHAAGSRNTQGDSTGDNQALPATGRRCHRHCQCTLGLCAQDSRPQRTLHLQGTWQAGISGRAEHHTVINMAVRADTPVWPSKVCKESSATFSCCVVVSSLSGSGSESLSYPPSARRCICCEQQYTNDLVRN